MEDMNKQIGQYAISLKQVYKEYDSQPVLNNINLNIKKGEVVSIIGPSGSGKSTLLRCLVGLEQIERGLIEMDSRTGENSSNNRMGMVFQQFNLFPHKTVLENVITAPMLVKKMPGTEAEKMGKKLLDRVGLLQEADKYPSRISGGQQQRAAIARALAMKPEILLFDEPTSALDPELVGEVLEVIGELAGEKMTMVIVTHEMGFAREVSDRIIFMDQGRILSDTTPHNFFSVKQQPRVQAFIDKII